MVLAGINSKMSLAKSTFLESKAWVQARDAVGGGPSEEGVPTIDEYQLFSPKVLLSVISFSPKVRKIWIDDIFTDIFIGRKRSL